MSLAERRQSASPSKSPLLPSASPDLLQPDSRRMQRVMPSPDPNYNAGYASSRLNPGQHPQVVSPPTSSPSASSWGPSLRSRPPSRNLPYSEESQRGSMVLYRLASEESALLPGGSATPLALPPHHRFSHTSSSNSILSLASDSKYPITVAPGHGGANFIPSVSNGAFLPYAYDPEDDLALEHDPLHDPDPPGRAAKAYPRAATGINGRGCFNVGVLVTLIVGIVTLFTAYPVITFVTNASLRDGISNNIFVNGTGQAANLINMPQLVDVQTPDIAKTRTGFDGQGYTLVFSDEFNTDNRTFYPGDDPYWEAVDLWYGATEDLEWYDPSQVTTADGYLRIKLEMVQDITTNHNLQLKSGMLQSWNKFCFTSGYIEIRAQLPGDPSVVGYWPGAWTMGNLGRPGYGATTDGVWPYTYDSCDIGTLKNQTTPDGTGPPAAFNLPAPYGRAQYNDDLSWLPGQRASSCTCSGEDHPGPTNTKGRGAPEIDILEAEKDKQGGPGGSVSQSAQFAPFSSLYVFGNEPPDSQLFTPNVTILNTYRGSAVQQAVSALTLTPDEVYGLGAEGGNFGVFAFEYWPDEEDPTQAYIAWVSSNQSDPNFGGMYTFTMRGTAIGPDADAEIQQRHIALEPMSIVLNLAVSKSFQPALDVATMQFPVEFLIDYIRVYQRDSVEPQSQIGCDPPNFPTSDYINNHLNAYTNPNYTFWSDAGYNFPKNSIIDGCTG